MNPMLAPMPPRLSLWYCLLGLPVVLAGGGIFVYQLMHGLQHLTDSVPQVLVPGKAELNFQAGQKYTVFLERQSVMNGTIYSTTGSVDGLRCRVHGLPQGDPVALNTPSADTSYELGSRSGHSVLEFTPPRTGAYEFACDYGVNRGPTAVMAVGAGVASGILRMVLTGIATLFGSIVIAVGIVIAVVVKRAAQMRQAMQAGYPMMPGYYPRN